MAIQDQVTNRQLEDCIAEIPSNYFTTLKVIDILLAKYPDAVRSVQAFSERNWRALIGKAIKRYAVETSRIRQISDPSENPARWEKRS